MTDGFEFYERVIRTLFGVACTYAQVIKTWRKNRVTRVERRAVIGTTSRLEKALDKSEDVARGDCTGSSNSRVVITTSFVVIPVCGSEEKFGRRRWSPVYATGCVVSGMSSRLPKSTANGRCTERAIGSIRGECLDYMIPLNETYLRKIVKEWVAYYNRSRPHAALGPSVPDPPPGIPVSIGNDRHRLLTNLK